MNAKRPAPNDDELRMSSMAFDKITRQALQVKPEEPPKAKKPATAKAKTALKKRTAK